MNRCVACRWLIYSFPKLKTQTGKKTRKKSGEVQVASVRCRLPSKLALASRRTPSMPPPIMIFQLNVAWSQLYQSKKWFTEDPHRNQDSASSKLMEGKSCLGVFTNPMHFSTSVKEL